MNKDEIVETGKHLFKPFTVDEITTMKKPKDTMKTENKTSKKSKIPNSLDECLVIDDTARQVHGWSVNVKTIGKFLLIALIIVGIIDSFSSADIQTTDYSYYTGKYYTSSEFSSGVFFGSLLAWGIYAILEYSAFNAVSILLEALSKIVQNSKTTSLIALYEANQKSLETESLENETNDEVPEVPDNIKEELS